MARRALGLFLTLFLFSCVGVANGRQQRAFSQTATGGLDLPRLESESILWLQGLLRINTVNPPGNELAAAKYLAAILQKEGINSQIFENGPGRGILVARLSATAMPNSSRALLLVGHLDTVGVNRSKWSVDPFAGVVKDNYLYGRGAIDDKGMTVANMAVMIALKRSNAHLNRDIIFLAEGGEDAAGEYAMKFAGDKYWDQIAAGFSINEGGRVLLNDGKVQYVGIQADEKVSRNLDVIATGSSAHGSVTQQDNPITHLAAAIEKIAAYPTPVQFNFITREYFEGLAGVEDEETGKWMRALEDPDRSAHAARFVSDADPEWGAMMRDTIAPTMLQAGIRPSVVPPEARGVVNLRLLPGNLVEPLVAKLQQAVNDPQVRLEVEPGGAPPAPASSTDSELYKTITQVARQQFPGAAVLPYMSTGATDSAFLRERSVQAYGLLPFPMAKDDLLRAHGDDERIGLDSFRKGIDFLYAIVTNFAVSK
ncbi:MAG TPA: M20/M25/M40 family metallo-hydrolase [Candidatus Acidoferrales bacterium]|nr:M20/M25/M40 family metallo-hydrolase [Candidatus Acidoferrales bacterium]